MRRRWIGSLALALGVLVPGAHAEEGWQGTTPSGGIQLGRPTPVATPNRPTPVTDPNVRPAAYDGTGSGAVVIRGSSADSGPPQTSWAANASTQFQWRAATPVGQPSGGISPVSMDGQAPLLAPVAQTPTTISSEPVLTMPTPVPGSARPIPSWPAIDPAVGSGAICGCGGDGCCTDPCCTDGCCPPGNRWYFGAEGLIWFIKGQPTPPLVTTSSTPFAANSGAIGGPGTSVLYGGSPIDNGAYLGGRFTAGWWCDPEHDLAFEVSGFFLGGRTASFQDGSNAQTFIARPFYNVDTGMNDKEVTAAPGVVSGRVLVDAHTSLWGAEANLRTNWLCCPNGYVDLLAGFRTVGLNESLAVNENVNILAGPAAGAGFNLYDSFRTNNQFYGGQIGAVSEWRWGCFSFDLTTKLALGDTQQMANIYGASAISLGGVTTTYPGNGILAQPTNSGHFTRDKFTVVPELGLTAGYQITDHLRFTVGYNLLYWSSVLRPGNQIDRGLDPNQFAPATGAAATRPAFAFNGSDFWAQGVSLGLEFKY